MGQLYCYETEDNCNNNQNIVTGYPVNLNEECRTYEGTHYYYNCLAIDSAEYIECTDDACADCPSVVKIGDCVRNEGHAHFCKVEGCGYGKASPLFYTGYACLGAGLAGCLCCCWVICFPIAIILISVACCIS